MIKPKAYAQAGVDIDLGNRVKATLPRLLSKTHRREVLGKIGGFGGLFALDLRRYRQPVLVSSVDGVGTKLQLAFAMDCHETIGQDLVNHCVNDIAVLGAEPLFFLDYIGTGKLDPQVFSGIIKGFANACSRNHCALIGGETAQMPGFYRSGEYDLSGTIVGVVERSKLLDGKNVRPGDAIIGLASSGLHTNGYSLARKIFFGKLKWKPHTYVPELCKRIGDELLKIHVSYWPIIHQVLKAFRSDGGIKAFAHITGGGFYDNIPRMLPKNCDVRIRKGSWPLLPIFRLLAENGGVSDQELFHVFNMGIGMTAIVKSSRVKEMLAFIRARSQRCWLIGEVLPGKGRVRVE